MRSAQASSISESQCCRIKEFVDNNEIFSLGSTPSRVLIYSWIKEGILPCKRINEERVIHLSALKTCLEAQALQKGFQYELGKTTLVKLSLFPSLFPPSAIPCRRTVYNLEKKGLLCVLSIGKSRFVDVHATEQRLKQRGHPSDRKSTRLNSSHMPKSRMPSSA